MVSRWPSHADWDLFRLPKRVGSLASSDPAVADGSVYVGSDDGKMYVLDAATGKLRWAYATGGAVPSSPAVAGGRVFVGTDDGKVYVRWTLGRELRTADSRHPRPPC